MLLRGRPATHTRAGQMHAPPTRQRAGATTTMHRNARARWWRRWQQNTHTHTHTIARERGRYNAHPMRPRRQHGSSTSCAGQHRTAARLEYKGCWHTQLQLPSTTQELPDCHVKHSNTRQARSRAGGAHARAHAGAAQTPPRARACARPGAPTRKHARARATVPSARCGDTRMRRPLRSTHRSNAPIIKCDCENAL